MIKIWKLIKGFLFILIFFGILLALIQHEYINTNFDIDLAEISAISFLFIAYFSYKFLKLYIFSDRIEYEFTSIVNHTLLVLIGFQKN